MTFLALITSFQAWRISSLDSSLQGKALSHLLFIFLTSNHQGKHLSVQILSNLDHTDHQNNYPVIKSATSTRFWLSSASYLTVLMVSFAKTLHTMLIDLYSPVPRG